MGWIFYAFPYTSYSDNVRLLEMTGVRGRWVCAVAGVLLLHLALVPKLSVLIASIPVFVLDGVGIIMFGMITVAGIKILKDVDFETKPLNGFLVAASVGFGLIPWFDSKLC